MQMCVCACVCQCVWWGEGARDDARMQRAPPRSHPPRSPPPPPPPPSDNPPLRAKAFKSWDALDSTGFALHPIFFDKDCPVHMPPTVEALLGASGEAEATGEAGGEAASGGEEAPSGGGGGEEL